MMQNEFVRVSSNFHGGRAVGTSATFSSAVSISLGCGKECACGGGHIEWRGQPLDLQSLPDAVLLSDREPTEAELVAATLG